MPSTRSHASTARSECSSTSKRCGAGWGARRIGATSGSTASSTPSRSARRKARPVAGRASSATISSRTRSAATRASAGRRRANGARARRRQREPERGLQPDRAERTQRVVGEDAGTGRAQTSGVEIGPAARGIDDASSAGREQRGQRDGERVDGEVARGQVAGEVGRAEIVEVELQPRAGHPGGAALGVEHHGGGAERLRHALGQRQRAGRQRHVQVGDGPAEQGIAHGAAHEHQAGRAGRRRAAPHAAAPRPPGRGGRARAQSSAKKRSALSWKIFRRTSSPSPRSHAHRRSRS